MKGNRLCVVYLLRRGAQKEAAQPEIGFKNETVYKPFIHIANYTNKLPHCNTLFKNFTNDIQGIIEKVFFLCFNFYSERMIMKQLFL